jgi:hypothetical protein
LRCLKASFGQTTFGSNLQTQKKPLTMQPRPNYRSLPSRQ